jgi:poly-beta-1,6-N-acetyl-D-glucosamine synthase
MESTLRSIGAGLEFFTFGYPFVMAWYWMIGASLFWFGVERHYRPVDEPPPMDDLPPISIIVPCHNEAETALETFSVLAAVDYPNYEIIAVNDGSRDDTARILEALADEIPQMRVVHLAQNQGKATAMNVGALLARHEFLVLIDGDALLDRHALHWVAWVFRLPFHGGLTGNPRIRNRTSLLGRLQVGEFSSIVGLIKRAQTTYGRLFTVSGVVCAFRKRALHDGGWWSPRTLTDDVDITWRVQRAGWRITYAPNVLVWILMPERLGGLWQQRLRWAEGGGQMLVDNAGPMLRGTAPSLLPVYVNAMAAIAWSYCILALMIVGLLRLVGLPVAAWIPGVSVLPDWYGLALCCTYLLQAIMSTTLEQRIEPRSQRSLFWVIWYPLAYWALSATTSVIALPRAFLRPRKGRTTWVSPDRGLR